MQEKKKTYSVEVVIGCTGGGFRKETNDLKEVEEIVNEYRRDPINRITVYDRKIDEFIFWKYALSYYPDVDMLHCDQRDFGCKRRVREA